MNHFTLPEDGGLIEKDLPRGILHSYEKISTDIFDDASLGSARIAELIAKAIEEHRKAGLPRPFKLGLTTGETPVSLYKHLTALHEAGRVSFEDVEVFSIDEYYPCSQDSAQSRNRRLHEAFLDKVDIRKEHIHIPDGTVPQAEVSDYLAEYEKLARGMDLLVIGIGESGQVGFNEPGTARTSRTRTVLLSYKSRKRQARNFNGDLSVTPRTAMTIGIDTMLSARRVILMAWGEKKAQAVRDIVEGDASTACPASLLQEHGNISFYTDTAAASLLTRVVAPWMVGPCRWTPKYIRKAVIWLCDKVQKPILKLSHQDYLENSLGELLELYGPFDKINIEVFNDLQHTITGWPGGKPNADDSSRPERALPYPKRVLVFSPHPDDAVVSMGGTLRRLVQQGHDVHVVFQTSGDITVADEDLERTLMLNSMLSDHYGYPQERRRVVAQSIIDGIKAKKPGDPDNAEMRFMKGRILTCESIMGCMYMGVRRDHIHELALPFYESNPYGRGKVTDADVLLIKKIIENVKPHQIFFADDLSDPYGTHMRATNALLLAIDELKEADFMQECRMWMYRGQWGTWDIDHIEMAVPMSPEEFTYKVNGVLKHQSQIHDAPFRDPGDGQLSWQKTIDRNKDTADLYASLGLATYEAMEAFVQYHPER